MRAAVLAAVVLLLQAPFAAPANAQRMRPERMQEMSGNRAVRTFLLADVLEFQADGTEGNVNVETLAWIGGDYRRLFIRVQGEQPTAAAGGGAFQGDILFGRLITPFWSAVAGARLDTRPGMEGVRDHRVTRGMLAVGLLGIAPFWFELEPTLYVSQDGDVSADFETSFDLLLTQRLIVQPRFELNAALQRVPEFGVGAGLNDVELGARMRYEIRRKFAPYVGVSWVRRTSGTAAMARAAGRSVSEGSFVAGVRMWR